MTCPPEWLKELADKVALRMRAADILAPIGCHYYFNSALEQWEITLFASGTEVIGGALDGKINFSRFTIDLRSLLELFDEVRSVHWQTDRLHEDDELGPHISIEGTVAGHIVWLRVLAQPPSRFEVGRSARVHDARIEEIW